MHRLVVAAASVAVAACGPAENAATREQFAPELEVNVESLTRTSSGLQYQDLVVGEGVEAAPGNAVVVHYTGWLTDGTKFDSSVDSGQLFSFTLGAGEVIAGWDEGVAGMKVGGKRKLVIPSKLGYGAAGYPPVIPRNATLVFDVELIAAQ